MNEKQGIPMDLRRASFNCGEFAIIRIIMIIMLFFSQLTFSQTFWDYEFWWGDTTTTVAEEEPEPEGGDTLGIAGKFLTLNGDTLDSFLGVRTNNQFGYATSDDSLIFYANDFYDIGVRQVNLSLMGDDEANFSMTNDDGSLDHPDSLARFERVLDSLASKGIIVWVSFFNETSPNFPVDETAAWNAIRNITVWLQDRRDIGFYPINEQGKATFVSLMGRYSTSADNRYNFQYINLAGTWTLRLAETVTGTTSTLTSVADTLLLPAKLRLEVETVGADAVLRGYVNDVLVLSFTDTTPTTAANVRGGFGIRGGGVGARTIIDDVYIGEL